MQSRFVATQIALQVILRPAEFGVGQVGLVDLPVVQRHTGVLSGAYLAPRLFVKVICVQRAKGVGNILYCDRHVHHIVHIHTRERFDSFYFGDRSSCLCREHGLPAGRSSPDGLSLVIQEDGPALEERGAAESAAV